MEFARKQLEKYGWTEGEGLGKNRDGISKALKPKLKFDNAGLGHDISEEFNNEWWQRLYNEAANNIVTNRKNEKVVIELKEDPIDIDTRKRKRKKHSSCAKSKKYKGFVKTSELSGMKEKIFENVKISHKEETESAGNDTEFYGVTNDELFKICKGRTAHKGARHGLKMSAKLARIMEQEKNLMKAVENSNNGNSININEVAAKKERRKNKKLKKHMNE